MGAAVIAAAAAGRHPASRCSTPATSTAGSEPRSATLRDADADAWAARVDALRDGPAVRIGAAIHSVRAVDPDAAAVVADWAGDAAAARPRLRAAGRERGLPRGARRHADRAARRGRRAVGPRSPRSTPPISTDADVAMLGERRPCCLCPTTERDLADGIGPARRLRSRRRAAGARAATRTRSSTCSRRRARSSSTSGWPAACAACTARRGAARRRDGRGSRGARLARGGADRAGRAGRPGVVSLDGVRLAGTPARRRASPPSCSPAGARTCATSWSAGAGSSATAQHVTLDVRGSTLGGGDCREHARRRQHRPARHQRRRSSASVRDAALVIEDGVVAAVGARARGRRPDRRRRPLRDPRLRRLATPTSCSPATGATSSPPGWPARRTRRAASA